MTNQVCARCGGLLTTAAPEPYCSSCDPPPVAADESTTPYLLTTDAPGSTPFESEPIGFEPPDTLPLHTAPDPDQPGWNVRAAFGVWLFSFAAIFLIPLLVVAIMLAFKSASGGLPGTREEMEQLLSSPSYVLGQVAATYPAHLLTIAVCWLVVTGSKRRPFLDSLGWHWEGMPLAVKIVLVPGVCVGVFALSAIIHKFLPNTEHTPFEQMLTSSVQIRYAVAALAVFTAPFVEEFVYRGVLYSALRKRLGLGAAVTIVTLLFAGVHVPQYIGAWAGIASLLVLSLILTLFRAFTKSIKPCVAIHLLFNAVQAVFLISNTGN